VKNILSVENLHVCVDKKKILSGVNLKINSGQIYVIMGPNGSGKSSLAHTLMGHPNYHICQGEIELFGEDLTKLSVDKRAKLGLFLAFQYPYEFEGVGFLDFLRQSYNCLSQKKLSPKEFRTFVFEKMKILKTKPDLITRELNVGFSGGERKQAEILQLAVLQPKLAILDEIDSGLDIDALKNICHGINQLKKENPQMSFILITHYPRILKYIHPDFVHVFKNGQIVESGGSELAQRLEEFGYESE
jgi:Fe-S cluster assembly ATP-binding protein